MLLQHLLPHLDALAPLGQSESWDNTGLLLGHPADKIRGVWLTIDLTPAVLAEASAAGAELILAYHPPWFASKKRLVGDDIVLAAARGGFAIYSPHTALDAASGGTNDVLADAAGIAQRGRVPLEPAQGTASGAQLDVGMGRVGPLAQGAAFSAWLAGLKAHMGVACALVAHAAAPLGESAAPAHASLPQGLRVAVCAGAGDGLLDAAFAAGAQIFVVGEMRHHGALRAQQAGLTVVCLTHSGSERAALPALAQRLRDMVPELTVGVSTTDADPYTFS